MGGEDITELLEGWRNGDEAAFDAIAPAVYGQLHQVAEGYIRGETSNRTLQATALVNEVFLKLMQTNRVRFASRKHFFTFAAKLMRRILVDHARRKLTQKRDMGQKRVELSPELAWIDAVSADMLDLERGLDELEAEDPDLVRKIEIRFFLGASAEETAELLGATSRSSVDRDIAFGISWLHRRLRGGSAARNPPL
jgi:RNA polymerase sigma factor (TIGR02999 family)